MAEAKAAQLAIFEAVSKKFQSVIFEGYATAVMTPLKDWNYKADWSILTIIESSKLLLSSAFVGWSISKAHRSANYMAHNLAQWALGCNCFGAVSPPSLPPFVYEADGGGVPSSCLFYSGF